MRVKKDEGKVAELVEQDYERFLQWEQNKKELCVIANERAGKRTDYNKVISTLQNYILSFNYVSLDEYCYLHSINKSSLVNAQEHPVFGKEISCICELLLNKKASYLERRVLAKQLDSGFAQFLLCNQGWTNASKVEQHVKVEEIDDDQIEKKLKELGLSVQKLPV